MLLKLIHAQPRIDIAFDHPLSERKMAAQLVWSGYTVSQDGAEEFRIDAMARGAFSHAVSACALPLRAQSGSAKRSNPDQRASSFAPSGASSRSPNSLASLSRLSSRFSSRSAASCISRCADVYMTSS